MIVRNIDLNKKIELLNDNNEVMYWLIYDFAYKRRMRIFDSLDNEVAYVNLKIESLNNDIALYDKEDQLISVYDKGNVIINEDGYTIKDLMNINKKDNCYELEVLDEDNVLTSIMYLLVIFDNNL